MGHGFTGRCRNCGCDVDARVGGGFFFHLLHCDRCGKTKNVGFDKLGETHARYIKGLRGPYTVISKERDEWIQKHAHIEPLSEEDYHREVEKFAGRCRCGGQFSMTAPPRCPACRSDDIENTGGLVTNYD